MTLLRVQVEANLCQIIEELSNALNQSWFTILLQTKAGVWVPHNLSEENRANRSTTCNLLLQRIDPGHADLQFHCPQSVNKITTFAKDFLTHVIFTTLMPRSSASDQMRKSPEDSLLNFADHPPLNSGLARLQRIPFHL
ncbi:UNVERIFIED_CONTAM: hypothetical protein NCL1_13455 [Trichonephila clavipes]